MIYGIGVDIVDVERIKNIFSSMDKVERFFTKRECQYLSLNHEKIAGNFALKEAFSKAIGTGVSGFTFKDMEFLRDDMGKPILTYESKILLRDKIKGFDIMEANVNLSISHERDYAVGFVVIEEKDGR